MEIVKSRQKKRYGWLIFFALINWLAIGLMVWRVDPDSMKDLILPGSYFPMTILVMGGVFWLLSILFLSAARALWWTMGLTIFLELRIFGLGTPINGLMILGLLMSWELYAYKSRAQKSKEKGMDPGSLGDTRDRQVRGDEII